MSLRFATKLKKLGRTFAKLYINLGRLCWWFRKLWNW